MTGFPLQSWFRRLSPVAHRRGRLAALAGRVEKLRDEKTQLEALEIVPGRHQRLLTTESEPTDLDPADLPPPVTVSLDPGDLVIFSLLTPHRSVSNRSSSRRALLFTYFPASAGVNRAAYYAATQRRLLEQLPPERQARAVFR